MADTIVSCITMLRGKNVPKVLSLSFYPEIMVKTKSTVIVISGS